MDLEDSSALLRTGDVPQTREMYIFSWRSGIPQDDSRNGENIDGPGQTQGHPGMVSSGDSQGYTVLPQILQLLLEVHPFFLQHHSPPLGSHQTINFLDLGIQPRESISESPDCVYQTTGPCLPWHLQTLHPHDRCLANSIRYHADITQHKQRYVAMWLSLPNLLTCWIQLWHL